MKKTKKIRISVFWTDDCKSDIIIKKNTNLF